MMHHSRQRDRLAIYVVLGFLVSVFALSFTISNSSPVNISLQAATKTVATKAELLSAISSAQPGDIIQISGTIDGGGIVIAKSGTQAAPIKIKGGTIKGGTGRMVEVRDSQWLYFEGITFDGAGTVDSVLYMLNSKNNGFVSNIFRNAGGECFRMKAGSQHNTLIGNVVESCGRTKWAPPTSKNAEGIYIGTAPEQISKNVDEASKSTASDKSGYMANPDNSDFNYVARNTLRPAYPENTKGNECLDIKEGARNNFIQLNTCSGQLDKNSGGMDSRGEQNIFMENTFNSIICGAGVRFGGDDRATQGTGNFLIKNIFNDYSNTNSICAQSVTPGSDPNAVLGAVKVEAPNQGYMCGNTTKNATLASGSFASQVNTTEFKGTCDDARVTAIFAGKTFGVPALLTPTPPISTTTQPSITTTPTVTTIPGAPCPMKKNGDANCKKDLSNGVLVDVSIIDFEIWRKEFFAGCSQSNLSACSPEDDADTSSPMDANFNGPETGANPSDTTVNMIDFEIWRKGYFNSINPTTPSPTSMPTTPTSTPSAIPTVSPSPTSSPTGCTYPSQILDLTNWKETLPIGSGSPTEILQTDLATYSINPWFKVNAACNGVQFRAHTSSSTTTSNSSYPRSELREMTNNGKSLAAWSTSSGTHTMTVDEAIIAVPTGKKHIVSAQIHDSGDDVMTVRLEYPKLYIDLNGTDGPTLDPAYTLGKRFTVKFVVNAGKTTVYYNNSSTPTYTYSKSYSGAYFKAGAYTQSNCSTESARGATCSESNYGEVHIYGLNVTHQ